LRDQLLNQFRKEVGQGKAKDSCNETKVQDRHVSFTPLDGADEGLMQIAPAAQFGFHPTTLLALPATVTPSFRSKGL
jgi:hypothetical protein